MLLRIDAASANVACVVRLCFSWYARLKGLLGTRPSTTPILLAPCNSIHTFFMAYPIDVAFISSSGHVVKSCVAVPPGRMLKAREAKLVVERPHQAGTWFELGARLCISMPATVYPFGCSKPTPGKNR